MNETDESGEPVESVKITDKRRIDPVTGEVRKPAESAAPDPAGPESNSDFEAAAERAVHGIGAWVIIDIE